MNRQVLIDNTIHKIMQLPDVKIQEINDFVDFLLSRIDDHIIKEGVEKLNYDSKSFYYLREEEGNGITGFFFVPFLSFSL